MDTQLVPTHLTFQPLKSFSNCPGGSHDEDQWQQFRSTPIARLPVELLEEVFVWYRDLCLEALAAEFARNNNGDKGAPNMPLSNWLAITAVCSQWRSVALQCARFWDHVVPGSAAGRSAVPEWFARTRGLPLHVTCNTSGKSDYSPLVIENMYRTRSLVIREQNFGQSPQIPIACLAFPAAEALERLHVGVVGASNLFPCRLVTPHYFFNNAAPRLTEVVLNDCSVYASALMALPALARLELVRCDVYETISANLLHILGTIPTLHDVTIVHTSLQSTWLPVHTFDLGNLRRLTFHGSEIELRWILSLVLAGGRSLERLRFRVDIANVYFLTTEWLPVIRPQLRALMGQFAARGHPLDHVDVSQHALGFFRDATCDIGIALEFEIYTTTGLTPQRELELVALFVPEEITPTSVRAGRTAERACCIYRHLSSAQKLHVDASPFEAAVFARNGEALFPAAEAVVVADGAIDTSVAAAALRRWRNDRKLKTVTLPPCLADSREEFATCAEDVRCDPPEALGVVAGATRPIVTLPWIL